MKHLTDGMAIATFANLPATFDSHDVQNEMRSMFPAEFQKEITWFHQRKDLKRKDRLQSFSIAFGRWLLKFTGHITRIDRRPSTKNLRGPKSGNRAWKKV